jgi:glycosyltransferase involved in cell wall biosynthesis
MFLAGAGGVGSLAHSIARHIIETDGHLSIFLLCPETTRMLDFRGQKNITLYPEFTKFLWLFRMSKILGLIGCTFWTVIRHRPRHIFCWGRELAVVAFCAQILCLMTPCVSMFSSSHTTEHLKTKSALTRKILSRVYRFFLPRMTRIGSQTQDMADDLINNFSVSPDAIRLTPPIISDAFFEYPPVTRDNSLLFVGRLAPEKNIHFLLDSFALALKQKDDLVLKIVGSGPLLVPLMAYAAEKKIDKHVIFTGPTQDVSAHYAKAALLVICSLFEGFPLVIGEAMAHGTPVISTAFRSGSSEIIRNGQNGYITPVGDAQAFADALIQGLSTQWDRDRIKHSASHLRLDHLWANYQTLLAPGNFVQS